MQRKYILTEGYGFACQMLKFGPPLTCWFQAQPWYASSAAALNPFFEQSHTVSDQPEHQTEWFFEYQHPQRKAKCLPLIASTFCPPLPIVSWLV